MKRQPSVPQSAVPFGLLVSLVAFAGLGAVASVDTVFGTQNLVTDDQSKNPAQITDPNLKNAWGVSSSAASPFWVTANGTGLSTLYTVNPTTGVTTKNALEVAIPPSGGGTGNPTGQVNNGNAGAFNGDNFLFVSENGTISGWRGALGTTAEVLQIGSADNIYKGTAIETVNGSTYLLSANFHTGAIDVLKGTAGAPDLAGKFTDPGIPSGYAPFNIQNLGGKIYVTYAQQGSNGDDAPGPGHGFVSVFDTQGNFISRIATMGTLNSPWGLAIAPSSFGSLAGDLLVGNFGDGRINAFNLATNSFVGQLSGANGNPLTIGGLWALIPGNGGNGGNTNTIYFSAGPGGEENGLFGAINAVPEPSSVALGLITAGLFVASRWYRARKPRAAVDSRAA